MCAIGTWAAFSLDTTVTYSLTALALISFVGSVSVARFRVRRHSTAATREQVPTMNIADIVAAVLVLGGSALALTAAIGVVRFPDTLSRMHAATKPQVLGLLLVLVGAAIRLRGNVDVGMLHPDRAYSPSSPRRSWPTGWDSWPTASRTFTTRSPQTNWTITPQGGTNGQN